MDDFLGCLLILLIIAALYAIYWLVTQLSWTVAGLAGPFGLFLQWLGESAPVPDGYELIAALLLSFALFKIAFMPLLLTHARVDRAKAKIRAWQRHGSENKVELDLNVYSLVLLGVFEGLLLLLTMQIVQGNELPWTAAQSNSTFFEVKAPDGDFGKFIPGVIGASILLFFSTIGRYLIRWGVESLFSRLTGDQVGEGFGFLGMYTQERRILQSLSDWLPLPVLAFVSIRNHSSVRDVIICFFLVKLVADIPLHCVSLSLDWRNDRWVRSLARQVVEGAEPQRRCEAAEKLGRLGRWAKPARATLEAARKDADERVRACVQAALREIR